MSTSNTQELTPPYFRLLVHLIRPFPNFDFWFVKSLRRRAAELLELKPGDRVLDGGCGPGASFPYLLDAVGVSGEVVGVEISPEVALNARKRIDARKWTNVKLSRGKRGNRCAHRRVSGDDIFRSARLLCISHKRWTICSHISQTSGRVVIFGAKLSRRPIVRVLNSVLAKAFSKATFASTPLLDFEPWAPLEQRLGTFKVQEYLFGIFFLSLGSLRRRRSDVAHRRDESRPAAPILW